MQESQDNSQGTTQHTQNNDDNTQSEQLFTENDIPCPPASNSAMTSECREVDDDEMPSPPATPLTKKCIVPVRSTFLISCIPIILQHT